MLNERIDSLETKIYVVEPDLSFSEIPSLTDIPWERMSPLLVIRKSNKGYTKSLFNDQFFAHSKYEQFNTKGQPTFYSEKGWQLRDIIEREDRSRGSSFAIADPTGVARRFYNLELDSNWSVYFQMEGIINSIKLLREFTSFSSWSHYDLFLANQKLQADLEAAKQQAAVNESVANELGGSDVEAENLKERKLQIIRAVILMDEKFIIAIEEILAQQTSD